MDLTALKNDFLAILAKVEAGVKAAWGEFCHIVYTVFTAEEQVLMAQAVNLFKTEIVTIQNDAPGTSADEMYSQLRTNATSILAPLEGQLAVTAIITTIGTALHDMQASNTPGNAGTVS